MVYFINATFTMAQIQSDISLRLQKMAQVFYFKRISNRKIFFILMMDGFRKYPYSPHRRDWNFLGVGGSMRPKNVKKCKKLNWNFQRGGEGLEQIPSVGGMDIFWNHTMLFQLA